MTLEDLRKAKAAALIVVVASFAGAVFLGDRWLVVLLPVFVGALVTAAILGSKIRRREREAPASNPASTANERPLKTVVIICLVVAGIDAFFLGTLFVAWIVVLAGLFYFFPRALMSIRNRDVLKLRLGKAAVACICGATAIAWLNLERHMARQRAEQIVAAVQKFRGDHSQYPNKLDDLVPAYLAEIPRTHIGFSGGRFQYLNTQSDHKLIYLGVPPNVRTIYTFEGAHWSALD